MEAVPHRKDPVSVIRPAYRQWAMSRSSGTPIISSSSRIIDVVDSRVSIRLTVPKPVLETWWSMTSSFSSSAAARTAPVKVPVRSTDPQSTATMRSCSPGMSVAGDTRSAPGMLSRLRENGTGCPTSGVTVLPIFSSPKVRAVTEPMASASGRRCPTTATVFATASLCAARAYRAALSAAASTSGPIRRLRPHPMSSCRGLRRRRGWRSPPVWPAPRRGRGPSPTAPPCGRRPPAQCRARRTGWA